LYISCRLSAVKINEELLLLLIILLLLLSHSRQVDRTSLYTDKVLSAKNM